MLFKLKQQINRYRYTTSNRLPLRRARKFLSNYFRKIRLERPSAPLRASLGLVRWSVAKTFHNENRIYLRVSCFITGRSRGTSQRYTVSRTRVKHLSSEGRLFGVRKSSW